MMIQQLIFLFDKWVMNKKLYDFVPFVSQPHLTVSNFIENHSWNISKLCQFLPNDVVAEIISLHIPSSPTVDKVVWSFDASGSFSLKIAYLTLVQKSSFLPNWPWYRIWQLHTLPRIISFVLLCASCAMRQLRQANIFSSIAQFLMNFDSVSFLPQRLFKT